MISKVADGNMSKTRPFKRIDHIPGDSHRLFDHFCNRFMPPIKRSGTFYLKPIDLQDRHLLFKQINPHTLQILSRTIRLQHNQKGTLHLLQMVFQSFINNFSSPILSRITLYRYLTVLLFDCLP